jgi:CO dehydrogenase maturation factor
MVIAIAGKGGVGKTTVGGLLVRYLVEEVNNGPVLAVDVDPNANFNEVLGVEVKNTIGEARELMKKDVPKGMTKDVWFEYKVHEAIVEQKGFDLLVMGRPEGPGCYCAANAVAKQSIDTLRANYSYIVVDNEAGMEHMSRLVTQDVDRLYVISDPTQRGLATAGRIHHLIGELKLHIRNTYTIVNRADIKNASVLDGIAAEKGITLAGTIRNDEALLSNELEGKTIFDLNKDSVALVDAYRIFDTTLKGSG